jgi:hypothetical protein
MAKVDDLRKMLASVQSNPGMPGAAGLARQIQAKIDEETAREGLQRETDAASGFANQGQQNFGALGAESSALRDQLRRYASGEDSLSAEQLRQGLQQQQSMQQSMAASARPANAAMAARTAAIQAGRNSSGMAGNAAMAGIAERQAATQSLGNMIIGERGNELNATNTARGQAMGGFNSIAGGARSDLAAEEAKNQAARDRTDGGKDADDFVKGLRAYRYRYTDEKHGKGEQLGIMAQDLERTRLGKQAVIDTPAGKAVHGAKLAGALAAVTARLGERLDKLEGGRK